MKSLPFAPAVLLLAVGLAAAAPVPTVTDEQLKERALKLNDITTDDARTAKLRELIKDRAMAKRLVAVAAKMQADAGDKEKPFKFNAALVLAQAAFITRDYKSAKTFYTYCEEAATKLDSESKLALAMEGLIDLAWEQKDYDGVLARCQKVLQELEGDSQEVRTLQFIAFEKTIQATAKKGDIQKALGMVSNAPFKQWYSEQLKSYILREDGQYEEAVEALKKAGTALEDESFDDDETKQRYIRNARYMQANVWVEAKEIDKAADILKGLMKDDPDNPTYPNDLGFIWCDHDMNLEESENLIRKALELDEKQRKKLLEEGKIDKETAEKRTSSYVDSLGWVLYKNKKYEEAKKLLFEATQDPDDGEHIEIWDHLADVYMALGETEEAVKTWTQSLKFDDLSKRDYERRKEVTRKLREAKKKLDDKKEDK